MIISDILQVIYAPRKAFKKIVENPKYIGALIILVLFLGLQVGYGYAQFSKTYAEQSAPVIGQLNLYTNATIWEAGDGVNLSNNFNDYFNYTVYAAGFGFYPNLFGNNSLEITAQDATTVSAALRNTFNLDCSEVGYQNISMTVKPVQPQTAPDSATLTLYSLSDSNYYQYDLTNELSTMLPNQWNNITLTIGKTAQDWTESGAPTWSNITALQLTLNYDQATDVTIRIGALYFHGLYQTPIQYNTTGVLLQFFQAFSLQFLFGWFLITGVIYLIFKGTKSTIVWRPLFVAVGFALVVMTIRAAVNIIATLALPPVYYTFDMTPGVLINPLGAIYYPPEAVDILFASSQAAFDVINAATAAFMTVVTAMFAVSYVWLGALVIFVIGAVKPEFSLIKRISMTVVSIAVTILVLLLFIGIA